MNSLDAILEVAIGLVFVWLILSGATMEAQNVFSRIFQKRAKFLKGAILDMFGGEEEYLDAFYEHPAIEKLNRKGFFNREKRPDYIPNSVFAEVAVEVLFNLGVDEKNKKADSASLGAIIDQVEAINKKNSKLAYSLRYLMPQFDGDEIVSTAKDFEQKAGEIRKNAEKWFDSTMTSASFWYKEKAQLTAFFIGFLIALAINVDTITIAEQLWRDPTMRQTLVAQAASMEVDGEPIPVGDVEAYYQEINLPVGWTSELLATTSCPSLSIESNSVIFAMDGGCYQISNMPAFNDGWGWLIKILGLTMSAFAAMQGAPFWFDMIDKILRISGKSNGQDEEDSTSSALTSSTASLPTTSESQAVG